MKVRALRNIISNDYGPITKGAELDVDDGLAKNWISAGAVEKVRAHTADEKSTKKRAPKKEKAVNPPDAETRDMEADEDPKEGQKE